MNITNTIYRENILDHNQNPRNKGVLEAASFSYKYRNPACGDNIEIQVRIKNGHVEKMMFDGVGCAISTASTSIMTDFVKGKSVEEVISITQADVLSYLGIPISPGRETCAFLPLFSLQKGIKEKYEHKK